MKSKLKQTETGFIYWKLLNGGTVPANSIHLGGTVPANITHLGGTLRLRLMGNLFPKGNQLSVNWVL